MSWLSAKEDHAAFQRGGLLDNQPPVKPNGSASYETWFLTIAAQLKGIAESQKQLEMNVGERLKALESEVSKIHEFFSDGSLNYRPELMAILHRIGYLSRKYGIQVHRTSQNERPRAAKGKQRKRK